MFPDEQSDINWFIKRLRKIMEQSYKPVKSKLLPTLIEVVPSYTTK